MSEMQRHRDQIADMVLVCPVTDKPMSVGTPPHGNGDGSFSILVKGEGTPIWRATIKMEEMLEKLEEGAACICGGVFEFAPIENCYCHLTAPCGNCTDAVLQCSECGEM